MPDISARTIRTAASDAPGIAGPFRRSSGFPALSMKRGYRPASTGKVLLSLPDAHGPEESDAAVAEALETGSVHPDTVRHIPDGRRAARRLPPLPADDPRRTVTGPRRRDLAGYDRREDTP